MAFIVWLYYFIVLTCFLFVFVCVFVSFNYRQKGEPSCHSGAAPLEMSNTEVMVLDSPLSDDVGTHISPIFVLTTMPLMASPQMHRLRTLKYNFDLLLVLRVKIKTPLFPGIHKTSTLCSYNVELKHFIILLYFKTYLCHYWFISWFLSCHRLNWCLQIPRLIQATVQKQKIIVLLSHKTERLQIQKSK